MGRGESACIYIGIKIKISTLIRQISEKNSRYVRKLLLGGGIENSEGENNLEEIMADFLEKNNNLDEMGIFDDDDDDGDLDENEIFMKIIKDIKIYKTALKKLGLYDKFLLIPNEKHKIINNRAHWGDCGSMSVSRDLDFDIDAIKNDIDNECQKYIKEYKIVMILNQSAG